VHPAGASVVGAATRGVSGAAPGFPTTSSRGRCREKGKGGGRRADWLGPHGSDRGGLVGGRWAPVG
jgi:hypothetical protein